MPTDEHRELCARMMVPSSKRLARIWELLSSEDEAKLLLAMPGTVKDLSEATGFDEPAVERMTDELFLKGVAFKSQKPQGLLFRSPRHLIQLHDASNQWTEAPQEFYDLWKEFMAQEYPALLAMMFSAGFPSFMRVVPTMDALAETDGAQAFEDLRTMVEQADGLAVCRCPCSLVEGECGEMDRCLQLGKGASYALDRGTGRALSKQEALDLLEKNSQRGLVHTVENKQGLGTVICNCCTCCCAIIKPAIEHPDTCKAVLAPSRFGAQVNQEHCAGDALCTDTCPVDAITMNDDVACVDPDKCLGCGLCLSACPTEAISLKEVRRPSFIPN